MTGAILFQVSFANKHVFVYDWHRESVKRKAFEWMGGDPDRYVVTPLTTRDDQIHLSITLHV